MPRKRKTEFQQTQAVAVRETLPEYGELVHAMESETASIITDYIRQYVGVISTVPMPGQAIFTNFDRVLTTQTYQELAWYDLYAEVERDPHVNAELQSAKLNVAGMPWDMSPYMHKDEKTPSERNETIADFVRDCLKRVRNLPEDLFNLMGAIGMGFAVSEVMWRIDDGKVLVDRLVNRPQRRFQFDAVTRQPKLRDINNPYYGSFLPDKKFVVHRVSSQWQNPFGDALDQTIYWMWLFKRTVLKFWMQHLQTAAASVPIVEHPAGANKELKAEALTIAQMIRNGAYGRIPDNFKILWAEAQKGAQNAESYHSFVRAINEEISKAINGQVLTSEAGEGKASYALGKVHLMVQSSRDVFRAHGLEETLNHTLVKWLVDFNFADVEGYPRFRFDLEDPEDLEREARIVNMLSDAGFDFDEQELSEKFNYTLTKKPPGAPKPAFFKENA